MTPPHISIIVPVYNTEEYLSDCINSILCQSFTDYEIIIVDDGSSDSSGIIGDSFYEKYDNIHIIHQENQGVTCARANGVQAAQGEFIIFVDSDDILPENALSSLIEHVNDDIDIVLGKFANSPCPPVGKIEKEEYCKMAVIMEAFHVGPCAKLYRRSLFRESVFDIPRELKLGEDAIMNIRLAYNVMGKVYSTDSIVYIYRDNPLSTTHTIKRNPEMDTLLQSYRLACIPENKLEEYLSCGLANNLIMFWMSATCRHFFIPKHCKKYHKFLLKIKNKSTLQLGFYASILFYCNNIIIRFFVITARNLLHFILSVLRSNHLSNNKSVCANRNNIERVEIYNTKSFC